MTTPALDHSNNSETRNPVSVILTSSGADRVYPDSTYVLGVTVNNQGTEDAVVLLFIDERSPQLRQWCSTMQKRLALAPGQTGEVVFQFKVPPTAMPDLLAYDLIVETSGPSATFSPKRFRNRQLQILAAEQSSVQFSDPTFRLSPLTTPQKPLEVKPELGGVLELWLDNRSERVDRFRVICSGLTNDWDIVIQYPKDDSGLGLVEENDSIGLNPGNQGKIIIRITPPVHALAGNYSPTLRLSSENYPNLGLLELIYLQVPPHYNLQPQIQVLQRNAKRHPARFEVNLANLGNTNRQVQLKIHDLEDEGNCIYDLAAEDIRLEPRSVGQVILTGRPEKQWRRPWFGSGKFQNFRIEITDVDKLPLTPSSIDNYWIWKARPWWQLLLLTLASLGLLGLLLLLFILNVSKPRPAAKILEFSAVDSNYSALEEEVARVEWRIHKPEKIKSMRLVGYGVEGEVRSGPVEFDLSQKIPVNLQSFCTLKNSILSCKNVRTDALEPGEYTFELTAIPKRTDAEAMVKQSQKVIISPKPIPIVKTLLPTALAYQEDRGRSSELIDPNIPPIEAAGIQLNWWVENPEQLAALHLVGRTAEDELVGEIVYQFSQDDEIMLPLELESACRIEKALICQNVATGLKYVGNYKFELRAIPHQGIGGSAKPVVSEVVKIQPQLPLLRQFTINGVAALPKYQIPVSPTDPIPVARLYWEVDGGSSTKVELLPSPGHVAEIGTLELPLNPQGSTTITLQITDLVTGQLTTRSTTFETFNPVLTPDPAEVAAAAAEAAAQVSSEATARLMMDQAKSLSQFNSSSSEATSSVKIPQLKSQRTTPQNTQNIDNASDSASGNLSPSETPPKLH